MEDISPKLLNSIQNSFERNFKGSRKITALQKKVEAGTATYKEVNEFAVEVGEILSKAFQENLSSEVLPDGRMYYNIAKAVVEPMLKGNHELITNIAGSVQKSLNSAAGIGIKPIIPKANQDRIDGFINKISTADKYDDVAWTLGEPVVVFSQSIVDECIKANAEFHYESGLSPKIVRTSTGKCCEWCNSIVGKYDYPDAPKDIYRRHDYCRCSVDYICGKHRENVHNGRTGKKRKYVKEKYGGYELSKEARIERAKQMAATEKERKEAARKKRIEAWERKKNEKHLDNKAAQQYNTSPAKKLKKMYDESVMAGWFTPLFSYSEYVELYGRIEREIVGKQTSNGILITGISGHFMERIIGVSVDPKLYKEKHVKEHRNGVELEDVKEALFSGKYRKPMENGEGMSQLFYTDKCKVTVNPDTGNLIQCNKL